MSTAQDRAAATAAKFARPSAAAAAPSAAPPSPAGEGPRPDDDPTVNRGPRPEATEPVRSTVDLMPGHHRQLQEWQADTAWALGVKVRNVSRQAVLEELVRELLVDETLRRKLTARLAERVKGQ